MKSFLMIALAFLAVFAGSLAADCEHNGHKFNKSQTYQPPSECVLYTCEQVGIVTGKACAEEFGMEPCQYIPEDPSKPYPECCPKFVNC